MHWHLILLVLNSKSWEFSTIFLCACRFLMIYFTCNRSLKSCAVFSSFPSFFFTTLKLFYSFKWYAYISDALHNSFLFEMHHCVKCGKGEKKIMKRTAQKLFSLMPPVQRSLMTSRMLFTFTRREQLRYMCLRYERNCVPFKRSSEASKSTWAGKYAKNYSMWLRKYTSSYLLLS